MSVVSVTLVDPDGRTVRKRPASDAATRSLDVGIALLALVFVLPLLVVLAILVWAQDGGAPIYSQVRIGRDGSRFRCLKFRSMVIDAEQRLRDLLRSSPAAREEWALSQKLRQDPRITPLGHFLRQSSLDELPQLFNVLAGQMSLVGPRPIVEAEIVRYGRQFRSYCSVRPGITGLWQVRGRNDVRYRRRVALDVAFARRQSLGVYVYILLATIPAVLTARGAS